MLAEAIAFYFLAIFLIYFAYKTISSTNPIHCALYLVLTMIGLAGMFYNLNAQFIAGVQLIVYAGAVMVLFVMVLMLFDLKAEMRAFSKGLISGFLKISASALLAGLAIGAATTSIHDLSEFRGEATLSANQNISNELATLLYSKYLYAFEALGLLLLVVAVGVVAVSRIKGGTHARH